jgi:hypothetical protein
MGGNKRIIVEMESFEGNENKGEEHNSIFINNPCSGNCGHNI